MSFVSELRRDLDERLAELRPLALEAERLQAALEVLEAFPAITDAPAAPAPSRPPTEEWTLMHERIARSVAAGYFIDGMDHEDVVQIARMGILKAIRTWDPSRGCKPNGWAALCGRAEIITALKTSKRLRRWDGQHSASLDERHETGDGAAGTLGDILPGGADPARVVAGRERLREVLALVATFSPLEREALIRAHVHGEQYDAIGEHKRVDNALQRAVRKLRAEEDLAA